MSEDQPQRRRIDIILEPDFVADLDSISLDELRRRRSLCDTLDAELSYYRRLLHGRMDLLSFEMRRRSGEEERSLLEALPEILAGAEGSGPHRGLGKALPVEVPEIPEHGRRAVDDALSDDFLVDLPSIDDAELERIQSLLTSVERDISEQRRRVYEIYELLQSELTERYRTRLGDLDQLI